MLRRQVLSLRLLAAGMSLAALALLAPSARAASPAAASPAPPAKVPKPATTGPDEVEDVRSGDKALKLMFETDSLGPVRRRGLEVGSEEIRRERQRIDDLKRAGRFQVLAGNVWTSLGPTYRSITGGTPQNGGDNSGLAADVKVHPTDSKTVYVATAGGGVWKTADGGQTWIPLTDDLGQLPIGAIAVAPSRPQRIYAGIGCGDTSSSYGAAPGFGAVISDDGGQTWHISRSGTQPGTAFFELDVDPSSPDVVLASTNTGVWRSIDGGESWAQVVPVPSQSLSRCKSSPNVVFAGTWGPVPFVAGSVWRSTDGGATFTEKAGGLPGTATTRARAEVAVAPTDPNRVYALFADDKEHTLDIAVSDSGGDSWTALNVAGQADILGNQGNTFAVMGVDPASRDVVYAGGLDQWKSTDGGKTWKQITTWHGIAPSFPYLHADQHAIAFSTDGSIYFATDGGIFRTTDGAQSFSSLNRGLVTLQFYSVCQSPNDPNLILGGQQDNGTSMKVSGTEWREVVGGDGFGCLVHPSNPSLIQASVYQEQVYRSTTGGLGWQMATAGLTDAGSDTLSRFITTLRRHPTKPDTIYTISNLKLWVSTNNASQWKTNFSSAPPGLVNYRDFHLLSTDGSRILLAGNGGLVYETLDEGATVSRIGSVPVSSLLSVKYDRRNVSVIWAASATTSPGLERVYRSEDGGLSWTAISRIGQTTGLPDVPVLVVDQDPWNPDVWWAGTYVGLYRSPDNGGTWSRFGQGLPNVIVTDVAFYQAEKKVRVATFGRGIWEVSATPVDDLTAEIRFPAADTRIVAGTFVSFVGRGVSASGAAATVTWNFSDGSIPATGEQVRHAFNVTGTYAVTMRVANSSGSAGATRTVTVVPNSGGPAGGQAVLSTGRVGVTVSFRDIYQNVAGPATPLPQADELAYFYFFDAGNPEVFVKVLDFGADRPYLVFYGGLTDFEYSVTFSVLATGRSVTFVTPLKTFKGGVDTTSLPHAAAAGLLARDGSRFTPLPGGSTLLERTAASANPAGELLLSSGQVGVTVSWKNPYDASQSGQATPLPQQDAFGYFYFFNSTNAEVFVKVLDFGADRPFLLFWAGLTDFEYTVTFRNLKTGRTFTSTKPGKTYDGGSNTTDLPH